MSEYKHTICRACHAGCGVIVEVEDGQPVSTRGNPDDPLFKGYCCSKGQNYHVTRNNPNRLLKSRKRLEDGSYVDIPVEQAMDEIAERLDSIRAAHGGNALALYSGTMASATTLAGGSMSSAWLLGSGSRMGFNSNTIDQPGKMVANALHGKWMAPEHNFSQAKVIMLIGLNPLVSMSGGIPHTNPGRSLTDAINNGLEVIVVDPRRTETARRASLYLQVKPGQDPLLLAAMIHTIIDEKLFDSAFIADNVDGLDALTQTVAPYTPVSVAERVGVSADEIMAAARMFANGKTGVVTAGTGPNMSGNSTLLEYLVISLNTLCGRWQREGEQVVEPPCLSIPVPIKAQAMPPYPDYAYGFGKQFRVRNLTNTAAGLPTAALADEILLPGEEQIKALISFGGNPVAAWPDQLKTIEAMKALDLLVQIDINNSATAKMADYVIAVKHPLEMVGTSLAQEYLTGYAPGYGTVAPYAHYTPAIVDTPEDSDLIEDWEFFYGLGQRMGLNLKIKPISFSGVVKVQGYDVDMQNKPDADLLIEKLTEGSRIALEDVRAKTGGALFPDPAVFVQAKDPDWQGRLDIGNAQMMDDLAALTDPVSEAINRTYPLRLISRRQPNVYNSTGIDIPEQLRGKTHNCAFMAEADLTAMGLAPGDQVTIESERASITAIVDCDNNVRSGLVSMTHCWGDAPQFDTQVQTIGSNTGRLSSVDEYYEVYTGLPRMSNIPVKVTALH